MTEGVVYMFTNKVNNKSYVGQTINEKVRFDTHLKCSSPKSYIDKAIKKYSIENFDYNILHRCNGERDNVIQELSFFEMYYVKKFNTMLPNGYNMTLGGQGILGLHRSEETKEKLRESIKKVWEERKASGWTPSEEFVGKCRKRMTGNVLSEETRKKISKSNTGKSPSQETREKIRQAHFGYRHTEEAKKKISQSSNNMSIETKSVLSMKSKAIWDSRTIEEKNLIANKISSKLKGRVFSEETRRRMSEAAKNRRNKHE